MPKGFLVTFCGLLLTLGAFSCDIMLPAFWSMERDLGAAIAQVQAVVPVFLMSSAFGQLLFGAASDRFGRRPVLVAGLALYFSGALMGFFAGSIDIVLLGRVLQGLGSACGVVLGRAILRDRHSGHELAQAMALAMAIFAFGPIFAPLLGFALVSLGGWRAVYAGMLLYSLMMITATVVMLRETNAAPNPGATSPRHIGRAIRRLLRHPQSRFFLFLSSVTAFLITSFIVNAPLLFKNAFGIEGLWFAVIFAATGLGIVLGQITNRRLLGRIGVLAATRTAAGILTAVSLAILTLESAGMLSLPLFALLMFVFETSFLVVMANSASLIIDPHKEIAGFASSVFGFMSQLTASALALLTLPLFKGSMGPWALSMLIVAVVVLVAVLLYRPAGAGVARTA